jgi:hypothetical protein
MPRAPKLIKRPSHRPKISIDWNYVDSLLEADCTGTEIAGNLAMHPETLYARVELEKGMGFTAYSQQKKNKGDTLIKRAQLNKALEGDNTMLVWLGKVRLNQRESTSSNITVEYVERFDQQMNDITEFQQHREKEKQAQKTKELLQQIQETVDSTGDDFPVV